jgi:hypothetical protein
MMVGLEVERFRQRLYFRVWALARSLSPGAKTADE